LRRDEIDQSINQSTLVTLVAFKPLNFFALVGEFLYIDGKSGEWIYMGPCQQTSSKEG